MKISHSWLQKLIYLPESPARISEALTALGLEVEALEEIEKVKGNLEGLVIGRVLTCEKHPDADKLSLTTVDVGLENPLPIVCGAPNVAAGQTVVVALVGATLYPTEGEPFVIKKAKIRGMASEGMICAEDEIGLGSSHAGIMVLDTEMPNGTPAARYFNLEATPVYEIGLTPNRVDAASHYGVARDLRAYFNRPVIFPDMLPLEKGHNRSPVSLEIREAELCPRYAGLYIQNVKITPSPEWMQDALRSIGLNPINNVVDITNYVLHELGHPLHAFDADRIAGGKIVVRKAVAGEKLVVLDKTERILHEEDLVIADAEKPLALAGIFGGLSSGVTGETRNIFLESAYFQPVTIRKSSQRHSLKTDSSFRFERGADPDMVMRAMGRAAKLIAEIAGGEVVYSADDVYPSPVSAKTFTVKWRNLNRLIGEELPTERVYQILNLLDIQTRPLDAYGHPGFEEDFEVSVPAYRVDVDREADIAEEVLRVYGLDNIKTEGQLRSDYIASRGSTAGEKLWVRAAQLLADNGFFEIITNSLTHRNLTADLPEFQDDAYVELLNPLSEELGVMRQTLLFSGLEMLAYNINRRQQNLQLFELGKVYRKAGDKTKENYHLGLFLSGKTKESSWESPDQESDFFYLKKVIQNLLHRTGTQQVQFRNEISSAFSFGQSLWLNNQNMGEFGLVKPEIARKKEVKAKVWAAELNWSALLKAAKKDLQVKEIVKFPEVRRDLSAVIDRQIAFEQIEKLVKGTAKNLLRHISVFDVYMGDKIEAGKKAYAMNIVLQDENQTLTDQQIDKTMDSIIRRLENELGAIIRR
jgi:phenylalanyl-tRNA synthetase beta chain